MVHCVCAFDRCAPLDVDQFRPVTAAAAASGGKEASGDGDEEVSAVTEINDETGAFEYTLYSLTAPPYIRLYVPGCTLFRVSSSNDHTTYE